MRFERGWECYQLVGGCRRYEAEFMQGQLEFNRICSEDATIIYNKVVVATSSHHSSLGWITLKGKIREAKRAPIWRYVTISQEAKPINFDIVKPKAMGADAECVILSYRGLGVCYWLAGGWR